MTTRGRAGGRTASRRAAPDRRAALERREQALERRLLLAIGEYLDGVQIREDAVGEAALERRAEWLVRLLRLHARYLGVVMLRARLETDAGADRGPGGRSLLGAGPGPEVA